MEKTEKTSIAACQQKGISLVALWYERYLASPFAKTLLFSSIAFTQILRRSRGSSSIILSGTVAGGSTGSFSTRDVSNRRRSLTISSIRIVIPRSSSFSKGTIAGILKM
mmetsp:Transcript_12547/g.21590  ORF Transcript_12547/g.21590 Transcript_12547/m.21590 type:complete len:109 (-) Transcript_12547:751-1077(-)